MMIQKIKTYAVLTAAAFTLSSCLDKYPEDSIPSDGALTTVSEVNEALMDTPEAINQDPYGAWLVRVEQISETEELLTAEEYQEHIRTEQ